MIKKIVASLTVLCGFILPAQAQLPPVFDTTIQAIQKEEPVRRFVSPLRILWKSESTGAHIVNEKRLLLPGNGQADLSNQNMCVLKSDASGKPSLLFDFGRELHGGVQIVTGMSPKGKPIKIRIRLGESASEAMSDIDTIKGATNDHAIRDMEVIVPWLGKLEVGNSGFRFVRIDLLDDNTELQLKEVRAIFVARDIPYLGSFKCSDTLLNKIWLTGAYTVHLNMQDYLWDGIKRDRLVWIGDMHPETSTIANVFGYNDVVPKSLDLSRDITPLPGWMNGISTYSMWWIIIHRDWYMHNGDKAYLAQQKDYLVKLIDLLISRIDGNTGELLDKSGFLDWPSSENPQGVMAGMKAMMVLSLNAAGEICKILNVPESVKKCANAVALLKKKTPDANNSKQGAALMALADMMPAAQANKEILSVNGAHNFSTFYGFYMLQAKAKAGDYQGALDNIREYWGAMLKLGATTFWEDFNLDWLPNASRIDELPKPGETDIHCTYGGYCYKGFRHSFCHGWASGPTSWLTQEVLGITVVEAGCKKIKIEPHLGDLTFAEGSFPTPYGLVTVRHEKQAKGKVKTTYKTPKEVVVVK